MKFDNTINIADIISALAVVASLAFVGWEIRNANNLAQAEAIFSLNQMMNEINIAVLNNNELPGSWAIILNSERYETLSDDQKGLLLANSLSWMNSYEAAWKYYELGVLDSTAINNYMISACREFERLPSTAFIWETINPGFDQSFTSQLESSCPALKSSATQGGGVP